MKKTVTMLIGFLAAGTAAAGVICSGSSAAVGIDTRIGARVARETEPLAYSTEWNTGATGVAIALDGETLFSAAVPTSGDYAWDAGDASVGLHKLTLDDGVEVLNTQFRVNGILFNANGGEGTMASLPLFSGVERILPQCAFSRTGYTFVGWATSTNGTVAYPDGAATPTPTTEANGVVSLYAKWIPNEYTVSFDAAGGTVSPVSKTVTFDAAYGALPSVSRTGYSFAGWTLDGVAVMAETICATPSNHTLVAMWTPNEYTVSFNANGGTVSPALKMVTFDATYGALPTPEFEWHSFRRWLLNGVEVDAATIVKTAANHTLVADWNIGIGGGVWTYPAEGEPIVLNEPLSAPSGNVVIPEAIDGHPIVGITEEAFAGNTAITAIEIPASVTNIAEGAFAECTGLRKVAIGSLYGQNRFADILPELAMSVREVVFLDGIEAIPDNFFEGCTALESMDISESVVEIGTNVFEACSALATTETGGLVICDGWVLGFAEELKVEELVVPEGIRGIAAGAFKGEWGIESLTLPESLRFIGAGAFEDCTGLENIIVPTNVVKIDRDAFRNCTYAQGLSLPSSLVEIGDGAFANCAMLMGAAVPDGAKSIGECAFSNCWRMLSVSLPQSLERVGDGAFADCRRIVGVTVPLHVATMAELFPAAYDKIETAGVAELRINHEIHETHETSGGNSEEGTSALSATLREFIASRQMVPGMFMGCAALESLTLPEWVSNIPDEAFVGCASLPSISVPAAVTNIGASAFAGLSQFTSFSFPTGLVAIGESAFAGCSGIGSLSMPEGLRRIGARAFEGLSLLARADIPATVCEIGDGAFAGCGAIRAVTVPGDAALIQQYQYYAGDTISLVETGDTEQPNNYSCQHIFPSAYDKITGATVATGRMVDRLFSGCAALAHVEMPANLAEIGGAAFENCSSLTDVGVPAGVTNIGARAFAGCSTLSAVALPQGLLALPDEAFAGCSSLAELVVPATVASLGADVFDGCTSLRAARFLGNAPSCGAAAYGGTSAALVSYVEQGSMGWDGIPTSKALPEFWPAGTAHEIAFWTPNRFNVAFDPCDGTGSTLEVEQVTGTTCMMPPDPVRQGARFGGWWTARENGARVTASTQVTATRPYTLYAHWTMNRYSVHFDANGGSGSADALPMTVGEPATLPVCPFTLVGHSFAGWATEPGGAVEYADGASVCDLAYAQNAAVMLYAVWEERNWTVPDYLDAPGMDFETEGDAEWVPDWDAFKVGGGSLRSGYLPPSEIEGEWTNTTLRTKVFGAGSLSFWWKVNCEWNDEDYGEWYDFATFTADGIEVARIAGDSDWRQVECEVGGEGWHTLEWTFWRDDYDEEGAAWENCLWVDGVEWTPAPVTLTFASGGATEGEAPAAVVKYAGFALTLPGPGTLVTPPYVFAGWNDGTSTYAAGETYVFGSDDATLTAVWVLKIWTLAEAADADAMSFMTGGDADWSVDVENGWTNGVSAKSGAVASGQSSWIETTVTGGGTLAFHWKVMGGIYRNNPFAYAKAEVDGVNVAQSHLTDGWVGQSLTVEGAGEHTIRWTYLRTSARPADGDCAWLDAVVWTPEAPESIEVDGVEVPVSWLDEYPTLVEEHSGSHEAAANAIAANGVNTVAECYVAGLVPTNATDVFRAIISWKDGAPVITWEPDLNEGGTKHERVYTVEGRESLTQGSWGPTNANSHFFRVKVELK